MTRRQTSGARSLLLFPQIIEMLKVARTANGLLVGDEVVERDEVNKKTEERTSHPVMPCVCELNTVDMSEDVDANGWHADLIGNVVGRKIFWREPVMPQGCTEGVKSVVNLQSIFGRVANLHVQLLGESRLGVFHHRIATHDQVFSSGFVEPL